jgi:protein disulfide-isomerase
MKKLFAFLCSLVIATHVSLAAGGWTDNYEKALAQAKTEKKLVLLDFTGSDWCGWCIKLDKEVFAKSDFKAFAKENLVPVTLDFPHGKKLPKKTADQNAKLKAEHGVSGFPTLVLIDADGKAINKWGGYSATFLEELKGKVAAAKTAK